MQQDNTLALLAVIPARTGSKRLPGKNLKQLGGFPLIVWTIRAALDAGVFTNVLVSTDDPKIAAIGRAHGASVPWLRPPELSTDTATSIDVVLHAVAAFEASGSKVDAVMLLQPTSPFRSIETIRRAVGLYLASGLVPVVSVFTASAHPEWCFQLDENGTMKSYIDGASSITSRSQDLPPAYQLNGAVYLASVADLRKDRSFFGSRTRGLVVTRPEENIDIDDAWDWRLAECIACNDVDLRGQD